MVRGWLVLSLFVACTAQAEIRAMIVATDPPGEEVTLGRNEVFSVRVAYDTDEPIRIWVRPYFNGKEVALPGTRSNPSITHSGTGDALGWVSFEQAAQADEVRIQAGARASAATLELARYPVTLIATGAPAPARTAATWVDELKREAEAKSRLEQQSIARAPTSAADTVVTYVLLLLVAVVALAVPVLLAWTVWNLRRGAAVTNNLSGNWLPYVAAAFCGFAVCLAISLATSRKEAWDSPLYFSLGIPVMVIAMFAISYAYPTRAWRWTLAMAAGQATALLAGGNSLSLWPLAIIAMTFVSLPQFAAGFVASRLSPRSGSV